MLRQTLRRLNSAEGCAKCPCFGSYEKYKSQIQIGGLAALGGCLLIWNSTNRARKYVHEKQETRFKNLEDDQMKNSASVVKLQKELKVAQAAILGQEATIRKLTDALSNTEKELLNKTEQLQAAIAKADEKSDEVDKRANYELKEQRKRLAAINALKAETDARFAIFEQKVKQCHDIPAPVVIPADPVVVVAEPVAAPAEVAVSEAAAPAAENSPSS